MNVTTNRHKRDLVQAFQVPPKVWTDRFAYYRGADQDQADGAFFRYKGFWYDLGEFMRLTGDPYWHGSQADSWSCGVVIRVMNDYESVIVGSWRV